MPKKAIDARIPALIRNGMSEKKRSFFVIVGDRQKDVIVNLYHILLNLDIKLNKTLPHEPTIRIARLPRTPTHQNEPLHAVLFGRIIDEGVHQQKRGVRFGRDQVDC